MKKILTTSLLFFGIISTFFGQKVTLGPELKDIKRGYLSNIIGKDENGIYVQRVSLSRSVFFGSSNYTLESYNMNMEKVNSVPFDYKSKDDKIITQQLNTFILNNKMYIINTKTDLNSKMNSLEVEEINKSSLLSEGNTKTLAEYSFEEGSKNNKGNYRITLSNDSTKLLVYYNFPYEKEQTQRFALHVFNKDFKELWKNEIELPYNSDLFDVHDFSVGNNGNVYLLGKVYEENRRERKKGEVNYKYHIIYYSSDKKEAIDLELDSKGKFFNEISMTVNNNNQVVCVGLYTSEFNRVSEGTFYLRVDSKSHKTEVTTFKEFSELMQEDEEDKDLSDKKQKRNQDRIYRNYDFRRVIQKEDGGIIVVAEQYYVVERTTTTTTSGGARTTTTTFYYHYDNILVLKIDKNGEFVWQKIIPKQQVTTNDGGYFLSFTLAEKGDDLYFLYNTTLLKKNKAGEDTKRFSRKDFLSRLSIYKLDKDGNLSEKTDLLNKNETKVMMVPKNGLQISENEVIMFGKSPKANRFALINLE
jgi:hypothetical protein